jgi:hypothetical protein
MRRSAGEFNNSFTENESWAKVGRIEIRLGNFGCSDRIQTYFGFGIWNEISCCVIQPKDEFGAGALHH